MPLVLPTRDRLDIFLGRLNRAPAADSDEDALLLIITVLEEVEDEYSGVVRNPDDTVVDGRMRPPTRLQEKVRPHPRVRYFRQAAHDTFVSLSGAFQIRRRATGFIEIDKKAADRSGVWES